MVTSQPDAVDIPPLPHTWRALRTRRVVIISSVVLIATITLVALLLPTAVGFTRADRTAMVGVALLIAAIMWALARSSVTATADGLTIVNIVLTRHLEWAQVISVRLGRNDPWAVLDLDDGSTAAAMGIATSDGARAREAAAALRALITIHSATTHDD